MEKQTGLARSDRHESDATERTCSRPGVSSAVDRDRSARLHALADRLERTLAHRLIELAPLAWNGHEADAALAALRVDSLKLRVAAAGLRRAADRAGGRP